MVILTNSSVMQQLQCVVFCGGLSSRMGTDKALLPSASGNWLLHSASLLSFLPGKVLASVNEMQNEKFTTFFPADQLVSDNLQYGIRGPVCGLFSVHEKYPENDLFVLACDMQQMNTTVLQSLETAYLQQPGFDAYLFTTAGEPEPLCGIYCSKGLKKLYALYLSGALNRHSMKYMLCQLNPFYIPATDDLMVCFSNFNSPEDIASE